MYPHDFDVNGNYPLLIFLHGAGERGSDNEAQLVHGSQLFRDSLKKYPAVVIFPQCPKEDYWVPLHDRGKDWEGKRIFDVDVSGSPSASLQKVMELIEDQQAKSYIDKSRIYIAGLSMGGMGTFDLLWRMPNAFAAAIPICGVGTPKKAELMKDTPMWIFHGKEDRVVASHYSVKMLFAVQKKHGIAKISMYPGVDHNSWEKAFAEPKLLSWLFSKRRE